MNTSSEDIQTLPAAQEQEMRAMQNLFQRAANVIVDASKLGEEVRQLREQLRTLLADTDRMREHIQWLEQENQTLRTQRDEAQINVSDLRHQVQAAESAWHREAEAVVTRTAERDRALTDANFWEGEASKYEASLKEAKMLIANLEDMLHAVWHGIKDHFTPKPEPEIAARVELHPDHGPAAYDPMPQGGSYDPNKPSEHF